MLVYIYFVTTARPAKDTAALYLDSVGFWYTKLISSSIFIASSGSFVQAIITAGRTGFGSPGQVMAAKNGPVGPKFTPDRIFRDRFPPYINFRRSLALHALKIIMGLPQLICKEELISHDFIPKN